MPCEHNGPPELIKMAERHLRDAAASEESWRGRKFRWSENVEGGMWASVTIDIERRGDQWVVTRLDRSADRLDESAVGFREL
jgi:hypothetical protein